MIDFLSEKIDCLVVIGSHARGDDEYTSDVDLIGIVRSSKPRMENVNKINLSIYDIEQLKNMMKDGDLFALHIKKEGIPLTNRQLFKEICCNFKYKNNYQETKKTAYAIGEIILNLENEIVNWNIANKRITWCVRTFLLSFMAENRSTNFSKKQMAFFGNILFPQISFFDFMVLIDTKNKKNHSNSSLSILRKFLELNKELKPSKYEIENMSGINGILKSTSKQIISDLYKT